jgi:NAD(P)-dependent dehydrogenase (short-subunit alcohol dehydrogenase family)
MVTKSEQPLPAPERDAATIWTPAEARGRAPGRRRLQGRRILVVGAGSQPCEDPDPPIGNGRAIAVLCGREGSAVACVDRDGAAARQTHDLVEQEGATAAVIVADVSREADCDRLVQDAIRDLKGIDGVVLNVGIGLGRGLAASPTGLRKTCLEDDSGCDSGSEKAAIIQAIGDRQSKRFATRKCPRRESAMQST